MAELPKAPRYDIQFRAASSRAVDACSPQRQTSHWFKQAREVAACRRPQYTARAACGRYARAGRGERRAVWHVWLASSCGTYQSSLGPEAPAIVKSRFGPSKKGEGGVRSSAPPSLLAGSMGGCAEGRITPTSSISAGRDEGSGSSSGSRRRYRGSHSPKAATPWLLEEPGIMRSRP